MTYGPNTPRFWGFAPGKRPFPGSFGAVEGRGYERPHGIGTSADRGASSESKILRAEHAGSVAPSQCSLASDSSCIRIDGVIGNYNRALGQGRYAPATPVGVITKQSNQYGPSWSNVTTPRPLDVKVDPMHPVRCSDGQVYLIGRPPNTVRTR